LYLSDRLEHGYIAPTRALVQYLGLQEGAIETLLFLLLFWIRGDCHPKIQEF
jgi:hypothetical protein